MIDILIPCLGRPESIPRLLSNWQDTCPPDSELVFLVSPTDTACMEQALRDGTNVHVTSWKPGPGDYARKMNLGYQVTHREWLFLGAQDITFTPGWFEEAMRHDKFSVISTNDHANAQVMRGEFGTHCLVRRSYVDDPGASADGPGYIIHEGYDHNFVDRELCGLAKARHVFAFAKNSIVTHQHPLWRTAPWDETYRKALRNFHEDRRLWLSRSHLWGYAGMRSREINAAKTIRRKAQREERSRSR